MDRLEAPKANEKTANIMFTAEKPSGNIVLTVEEAAVGYLVNYMSNPSQSIVLSSPINIDERKGEAIAIVGPNGIGKTTLIKSIIGQIPFLRGQAKLGANVSVGYYDQEQGRLTPSNSVLDELWNDHPLLPEVEIRTMLGAFLFSGEDVKKAVAMLSGGEKARLLLAKLAMEHDNFLVLDEPTNHLDIDSRESLENSLIDFDGTILFVSHDRYFINRVATRIIEISENGSQVFMGDYDYYSEKKAEQNLENQDSAFEDAVISAGQLDFQAQKEVQKNRRKLERESERLETRLDDIDKKITNITSQMHNFTNDFVKLGEFQSELDQLRDEKEGLEIELLDMLEALEDMS